MCWSSIWRRSVFAGAVIAALGGCGVLDRELRRSPEDIEIKDPPSKAGAEGTKPKKDDAPKTGVKPSEKPGEKASQKAGQKVATKSAKAQDQWTPPVPKAEKFDWVKLKSGEWLKGEFKVLREESVDFESEELDSLELDWDKIHEVRLAKNATCVFTERRTTFGTIVVRDGVVHVRDADAVIRRYPRKLLTSIVPGRTTEFSYWDGRLSAGLTSRSGNVDQFDFTGSLEATRRTDFTRVTVTYAGDYGELDNTKSSSDHRATGSFDVFLRKWLFLTPFALEVYRDPFQNIKLRYTPSVSVGVTPIDVSGFELDVTAGAGYRRTRFQSVAAGEDRYEEETVGLLGFSIDADLTKKVEFKFLYNLSAPFSDSKANVQHAEARLEIDLTGQLELDVGVTYDRQGRPERDQTGNLPEKADTRVTVGLAFEF